MISTGAGLKVVFASAEAAPIARVGGLAEASAGLIRSLRATSDVELTVVLPDYGDAILEGEEISPLPVPEWVGEASVRVGEAPELGEVHLVSVPGLARPHPYVDASGEGWADNHHRFFGFSAGVAAIVEAVRPDVVHINDWHTAMTLAWVDVPSVYTIHTLGYQGHGDIGWLRTITTDRATAFDRFGELNPAAGAIRLADRIIAVSPNYATEILDPGRGSGLHTMLEARGEDLVGIRNGIDTTLWDPSTDPFIAKNYGRMSLADKSDSADALLARAGWDANDGPLIGVVTRLVEQKGIDMILGLIPYLERMGARLFVLGSGEERLALWARELASEYSDTFAFVEGYDLALAHQVFAGADLFCMPSRFEPCGLAQMQAMAYGTIPVVTPVGGLVDTVVDADEDPKNGTGFVSLTIDGTGMLDALHRATGAWRNKRRRTSLQKRGMAIDWSWDDPTSKHLEIYECIAGRSGGQ
jgi:starch synthase